MSARDRLGRQWDSYGYSQINDPVQAKGNFNAMAGAIRHFDTYSLDWDTLPEQHFEPHELHGTQADLERGQHRRVRDGSANRPDEPVRVVKAWDKHYIYDGHHRVDLASEQGKKVRATVFDADAMNARFRR